MVRQVTLSIDHGPTQIYTAFFLATSARKKQKGIAHWKVSVGYGLTQLAVGLSVLWIMSFGMLPVLSLLTFYFIAFALFGQAVQNSSAQNP